jgi:hypothetical protein
MVTRLCINRGAVFSVLRGPCHASTREPNSEAVGCRSTEERTRSTTKLSVGDSHGKLVVEEELEVSL